MRHPAGLFALLLVGLFPIVPLFAITGELIQLTDNDVDDGWPDVSGSNVVWLTLDGLYPHHSDGEVFLYDGTTTIQLSSDDYSDGPPQVSGSHVAWTTYSPPWENRLLLYDGSSTTTVVTSYEPPGLNFNISGSNVAWQRSGHDIYLYDGATTTRLTQYEGTEYVVHPPDVFGTDVVWPVEHVDSPNCCQGFGGEIFLYSGGDTTHLSYSNVGGAVPQISGSNVAWMGWEDENYDDYEIYFYDGTVTTQLTDNDVGDYNPQVCGSRIVWRTPAPLGSGANIFLYDGTTTIPIGRGYGAQISGSRVAWVGLNSYPGIFLYDGSTTTRLTDWWVPSVRFSGSNIVWVEHDGHDDEIFLYRLSEPATLTSIANGSWGHPLTWDDGGWAPSADYRTVVGGHTVTLDAAGEAFSLAIRAGGTLAVPAGTTLTIVEDVQLEAGKLEIAASGSVTVGTDVSMHATGALQMELAGSECGQLAAAGAASLPGQLELTFSGATPFEAGTHPLLTYDSRTGTFNSVTDLNAYVTGDGLTYGGHELLLTIDHDLLIGDLDLDGDVDFFDYIATSNNFGETDGMGFQDGDMDGDGDVDFFDYIAVSNHFGDSLPEITGVASAASVPEPGTLVLLTAALAGLGLAAVHRRREPVAGVMPLHHCEADSRLSSGNPRS